MVGRYGLPTKRELQRAGGQKVREPVLKILRRKALEKANFKCQWKGCNVKNEKLLDIHHKNMRNDDNRISNFMVLCPTHHRLWHQENEAVVKRDPLGNRIVVKIKRKPVKKKKARMSKMDNLVWGSRKPSWA